jgi:hypothetical protein
VIDYATETPVVSALTPVAFSAAQLGTQVLTVNTDIPVSASSTSFSVAYSPAANFGTAPTAVTVPLETTSGTFTVSASAVASGTGTISVGAQVSTMTVVGGVPECPKGQVVISTMYGQGGNSSAFYRSDYVELFNRGPSTCKMTNWSVQYASAAGTTWNAVAFTKASFAPYTYYLVAEAANGTTAAVLPTSDSPVGTANMSGTTGKVLLLSNGTAFAGGACPTAGTATGYIDFLGYGAANCFETALAPTVTTAQGLVRKNGGCTDGDNNSTDYAALLINDTTTATTQAPRNSASPALANPQSLGCP